MPQSLSPKLALNPEPLTLKPKPLNRVGQRHFASSGFYQVQGTSYHESQELRGSEKTRGALL